VGESFLHRARLVELFRLAKFDAVNQRELDHALEMDLWELFPHDLDNLLAVLLPILLQVAKEILAQLVARPERPPRTAGKPLQPAAAFVPRDDVFAIFAI
jgi:hypothetical protein